MRVDQKQIQALAGFRNALRRFLAFSDEVTRSEGLTVQQYQAMLAIKAWPQGSISVSELATELLLKPNSAVQLLDRLSSLGYVERQRSEASRRVVKVTLTEPGEALLMRLASLHIGQLSKRTKQLADILRQLRRVHSH